jgi:D-psicose/D-tagatose/L-ribulose 3-epimerase
VRKFAVTLGTMEAEGAYGRNPVGIHALVWAAGWSSGERERALDATKRAGYDFIEVPLLDPSRVDGEATRRSLEDHGLFATCSLGLSFETDISSPDPEVVRRGEALLLRAVEVAAEMGADYLGGVLYSAMGKYPAPARRGAAGQVAGVLATVAGEAQDRGITIGLEPVNRYESNLVNCARQALEVISLTGAPNMVVHLDSYHMNIEEGDMARPVKECGPRLGYLHVGESHRGYLGSGTIDFARLFKALLETGYAGRIAFESFSSVVVSPEFSSALAVWRDLWHDSDDLARHARQFVQEQLDFARGYSPLQPNTRGK